MEEYNIKHSVTGRMQELEHEYRTEDLFALRAECEMLLNLNDGQLAQLNPGLWTRIRNFFSGRDRKNRENIMITQHQIMELYNVIFDILIKRQINQEEIIVHTQGFVLKLRMKLEVHDECLNDHEERLRVLEEHNGIQSPPRKSITDAPAKYVLPEENPVLLSISANNETDTADEPSGEAVPESAKRPHKLLRITPEEWCVFQEGHNQREEFSKTTSKDKNRLYQHLMPENVPSILKLSGADIVVTSRGFLEKCDEASRELLASCTCMTIADYYMYLWFTCQQEISKGGKAVAVVEYYDYELYVSGYLVSEDGSDYERLFSDLKIYYNRLRWGIISDIRECEQFAALGLPPESILIYRTFHNGYHLDYKLDTQDVPHVMPEWENLLRENFTESVEDLLSKSPLIRV